MSISSQVQENPFRLENANITILPSDPAFVWRNPIQATADYFVFKDIYAVTPGHLLFIPREKNSNAQLMACYQAAEDIGRTMVMAGKCDGFNIGRNNGESAGQTVMWPHIHMIPRRTGDMEDPRGGVRHVIPERGNYKKW